MVGGRWRSCKDWLGVQASSPKPQTTALHKFENPVHAHTGLFETCTCWQLSQMHPFSNRVNVDRTGVQSSSESTDAPVEHQAQQLKSALGFRLPFTARQLVKCTDHPVNSISVDFLRGGSTRLVPTSKCPLTPAYRQVPINDRRGAS